MNPSQVQRFLRVVERRQTVVSIARQWRLLFLVLLGIYAAGLILSRLFGFLPGTFTPATLAAVPVVSLVLAVIFHSRIRPGGAARLADAGLKTKDLFLTASMIPGGPGDFEYQDLVVKEAEARASEAVPEKIVPFQWGRPAFKLGAALAVLAAAVYLLPQWDPFGLQKRERQLAEQRQKARELSRATEARAALLEQQRVGQHAEAVKQALANLEKTFQEAKPADKAVTLARLNEQQKIFGQLWKAANEEKLKNSMNLPPPNQSFGLGDPEKSERLREDLQKGDISTAKRELDELKQKAEQLAKTSDPVEREKLRQELMDRVQTFKNALAQGTSSQPVNAALQRALEQLAMSNLPELSDASLNGMCDSLNLTEEELRQLAEAMADMKNLEEALKALQYAKALHNLRPLDGRDFARLGDLEAYAAFCQSQCQGLGIGPGMNAGLGAGRRPYGDENQETAFNPGKAPSILQPGRMLMEWKSREVSESGPAREQYLQAIQAARQEASEAVVQEQIPPGYQAAIKVYFDTLQNDAAATPQR